ncbi:MAG: hypothetical protein WC477_03425 [Patescibacteria group bacterium]
MILWIQFHVYIQQKGSYMTNIRQYSQSKKRVEAVLGSFSSELKSDIGYIIQIADSAVAIAKTLGCDQPEPVPSTQQAPQTSEPPVIRQKDVRSKKRRSQSRNKLQRNAKKIPLEEKDGLRMNLLRADKKGSVAEVKKMEQAISVRYRKAGLPFRTSCLRTHSHGEWKGPFIARMLAHATTDRKREALITEFAELYGETRKAIIAASQMPSPCHKNR